MEAVKTAAPTPQVEISRGAALTRYAKAAAPVSGGADAGGTPAAVDAQDLDQAARELAGHYNLKMEVAWDDRTGRQVLKVLSPDGGRLLRQFPAETVLKMAERLRSGADDGLLTSLV